MISIPKKKRQPTKYDDPLEISLSELSLSQPDPEFNWKSAAFIVGGIGLILLLMVNIFPRQKAEQSTNIAGFSIPVAAVVGGLSAEEKRDLLHMVEEEKLARDVYLYLHRKWGLSQFNSIARSEEQHVNAVLSLIQRYGLTDPITGSQAGVFRNTGLANLYVDLIKRGSISAIEALRVGGLIEELDILDLENAINIAQQNDIRQVYKRIQRGSFNHLRSFSHALELVGQPYQPVKLTNDSFQTIVHSPMVSGF
jgi:hypothetical protein